MKIQLSQDIKPLSEFRANVASYIEQVNKTHRPIVITTHGKSAAVLLNVSEYEALIEKIELIEDVHRSEKEIRQGKVLSQAVVKRKIMKMFKGGS